MPVDKNQYPLHKREGVAVDDTPGVCIYHLGHALPREVMKAKHKFYLDRDGVDAGRLRRRDVWHNWNGELGNCGDGVIERVDWRLPDIVGRALLRVAEIK